MNYNEEQEKERRNYIAGIYKMNNTNEGVKHDQGKARFDLLPYDALWDVAEVYTFGAKKYEDHNWARGMKWSRIFGAMMRHAWAYWGGEDLDKESGLPHMSHVAWCALTLLSYRKRKVGTDDRFIVEKPQVSYKTEVKTPVSSCLDGPYNIIRS